MRRIVGWQIQHALDLETRMHADDSSSQRLGGDDRVERCEILLYRDLRRDDRVLVFPDPPSARGFLRRLASDPLSLSALRDTLADVSSPPEPARLRDDDVLDQLA